MSIYSDKCLHLFSFPQNKLPKVELELEKREYFKDLLKISTPIPFAHLCKHLFNIYCT